MIVENLFRDRKIRVLCCTSTLALGVNLPAHLVVIKGTSHWQGKGIGYAQMDSSQILQMMGRAGRPGQDDNGVAVIMTDEKHRQQYERLAQGSEVVESRLHEDLVTVLNAEINNRVIESIEDAANWIRGTFLFTRITKNPQKYGLGGQISNVAKHGRAAEGAVVSFLNEKLKAGLRELSEASLCDLDEDGIVVAPNKMGQIMSRSMLKLDTMRKITKIDKDSNIHELLRVIAGTVELREDIRMGQKKVLKELNKNVRFKLPKSQKLEVVDKSFLLLQCTLGQLPVDDVTLSRERVKMADQACRVLRACIDHAANVSGGRALLSAVILCRNLSQGVWDDSAYASELHQLDDLSNSPVLVAKLRDANVKTIKEAAEENPALLDSAAGRRAPFGSKIVANARRILEQSLSLSVVSLGNNDAEQTIRVDVASSCPSLLMAAKPVASSKSSKKFDTRQQVSYTLVAFTKQPKRLSSPPGSGSRSGDTAGGASTSREKVSMNETAGVHLFRKISTPCSVIMPKSAIAATKTSKKLFVSLIANVVGLDKHVVFSLDERPLSTSVGESLSSASAKCNGTEVIDIMSGVVSPTNGTTASTIGAQDFIYNPSGGDQLLDGTDAEQGEASSKKKRNAPKQSKPSSPAENIAKRSTTSVRGSEKSAESSQVPTKDAHIGFDQFRFVPTVSPVGGVGLLAAGANETATKYHAVPPAPASTSLPPWHQSSATALPKKTRVGFKSPEALVHNTSSSGQSSPTAQGLERKTTVSTRGIRDAGASHLNTLRRKATESNLLQKCKSSRLRDEKTTQQVQAQTLPKQATETLPKQATETLPKQATEQENSEAWSTNSLHQNQSNYRSNTYSHLGESVPSRQAPRPPPLPPPPPPPLLPQQLSSLNGAAQEAPYYSQFLGRGSTSSIAAPSDYFPSRVDIGLSSSDISIRDTQKSQRFSQQPPTHRVRKESNQSAEKSQPKKFGHNHQVSSSDYTQQQMKWPTSSKPPQYDYQKHTLESHRHGHHQHPRKHQQKKIQRQQEHQNDGSSRPLKKRAHNKLIKTTQLDASRVSSKPSGIQQQYHKHPQHATAAATQAGGRTNTNITNYTQPSPSPKTKLDFDVFF